MAKKEKEIVNKLKAKAADLFYKREELTVALQQVGQALTEITQRIKQARRL